MKRTLATLLVLAVAAWSATATVRITEWMYSGADGEFIEFTNVGAAPVDFTGWSFDDDSRIPGTVSLSAFGAVQPGESVILTESSAPGFTANWALVGVKVIGGLTANLGRNDEINLYDAANNLVDRLTYGDQNFPGSIRTQNKSGNPITPAALGANDVYQWQLSFIGDGFGTYASAGGDLGNPGVYIPEPASLGLLVLALGFARRR
ncbi:MAG: lamin tail domain-containing protein [Phycisphaerales bacterium]|nr:lamin tail domain-containing protein [Phycisphaerales bacterium]